MNLLRPSPGMRRRLAALIALIAAGMVARGIAGEGYDAVAVTVVLFALPFLLFGLISGWRRPDRSAHA